MSCLGGGGYPGRGEEIGEAFDLAWGLCPVAQPPGRLLRTFHDMPEHKILSFGPTTGRVFRTAKSAEKK